MVKFATKADDGYKTISGYLRVMAFRAGDAIGQRWDIESKVDAGTQTRLPVALATLIASVVTECLQFASMKPWRRLRPSSTYRR